MIIKDLESLKIYLKKITTPVFGVGVYAFNRLGLENLVPNYRLLTLRRSLETNLIEKDVEVFSVEKSFGTKHVNEPRNSTTVIKTKSVQNFIRQKSGEKTPAFVVYKSSGKMERIINENNWVLASSSVNFGKKLFENKIIFRQILQNIGCPVPPGEIMNARDLRENNFHEFSRKYGIPFVVQHPTRGGGKGTFFIRDYGQFISVVKKLQSRIVDDNLETVYEPADQVIIAKYIKGSSPSTVGCVTKHGVLATSLQKQILDMPELYNPRKGSGLFCGHDWTSSRFPSSTNKQAIDITKKIGAYFQKKGYKGIFGIDFVLDESENALYITEANPRLTAAFPTLTMCQLKNNEPPILAFHLLEFLNLDYEANIDAINKLIQQEKQGAQMILHNLTTKWARSHKTVKPGIYEIKTNKLRFKRPAYDLRHIRSEDEFVVTEGILVKKSHYSPNRRLCRILTLRKVLSNDSRGLTPWASHIAGLTYDAFDLKPIKLIKLKKIFKPNLLAKG